MEKKAPPWPWGLVDNNDTIVIMPGTCRRDCKDFPCLLSFPLHQHLIHVKYSSLCLSFVNRRAPGVIGWVYSVCPHVSDPGSDAGTQRCGGQSPERSPFRKAYSVPKQLHGIWTWALWESWETKLRAHPWQGESLSHLLERDGGHGMGPAVLSWPLRH